MDNKVHNNSLEQTTYIKNTDRTINAEENHNAESMRSVREQMDVVNRNLKQKKKKIKYRGCLESFLDEATQILDPESFILAFRWQIDKESYDGTAMLRNKNNVIGKDNNLIHTLEKFFKELEEKIPSYELTREYKINNKVMIILSITLVTLWLTIITVAYIQLQIVGIALGALVSAFVTVCVFCIADIIDSKIVENSIKERTRKIKIIVDKYNANDQSDANLMLVTGKYGGWIKIVHKCESPNFYSKFSDDTNRKALKPISVNKIMPKYDLKSPKKDILIDEQNSSPKFTNVVEINLAKVVPITRKKNSIPKTDKVNSPRNNMNFSPMKPNQISSPEKINCKPKEKEMFENKVSDKKGDHLSFAGSEKKEQLDWSQNFKNEQLDAQSSQFDDNKSMDIGLSAYPNQQKFSDEAIRTDDENQNSKFISFNDLVSEDLPEIRSADREDITSFRERVDTERQEFLDEVG